MRANTESLKMPRYIFDELAARGVKQHETTDLDSVINQSDVLYVTRVQKVGCRSFTQLINLRVLCD